MTEKPTANAHPQFELADHLPYLFKHIYSQLEVASAGQLARFGINVAVWRILAVLSQRDDLSHRELAELTSIEVSTLSRISKSVQRDGYIRRKRTVQDQRTVRVTLTPKGRTLINQMIPWAHETQADIIGNLNEADVEDLIRILHVIVENLNRYSAADRLDVGETPTKSGLPLPPVRKSVRSPVPTLKKVRRPAAA